ncbi:F0F1 ATP synthase subunit A [Pontimicrobium aquaticum]|uniref:ATP synthase subunit a n=1 Tax=Pontimicrobium aquaticum TaxID=2565367 RepID=A0A4U0ESM7_9FLAO|nr:F0F1 ATP synthase subunit A [Pontimicrobium aquaticum]TJY34741.1 F0F1 ATP synthase subunit A [Pontimicrobium aquaticum]
MRRKISLKPITLLLLLITFVSYGAEGGSSSESGTDKETEIKEYIQHHLQDSYDFTLFSWTTDSGEHKYFGFPLPVIIWDNGLKVFSSSKFHHGEAVAEVGGNYYKVHHSKIYKVDGLNGEIIEDADHHATNEKPLDFSITKNVTMIMMVFLIMFFMFKKMASAYQKNRNLPKGMGRLLEPIVLYIRDDIARPNIGEKNYKRYMSYLLTVFFFVWIVNLFGLTPIGMNVTNNIAVTFCLAIITYLITTFTAKKDYWKHIFWMPGVPVPMKIILAPIELLGTFIKPFSLMIRLYANITAGHIVMMSLIGMMFIFKNWIGTPLSFALAFVIGILELLVAALQAYIFTMLSALYFGSAVEEHDHEAH